MSLRFQSPQKLEFGTTVFYIFWSTPSGFPSTVRVLFYFPFLVLGLGCPREHFLASGTIRRTCLIFYYTKYIRKTRDSSLELNEVKLKNYFYMVELLNLSTVEIFKLAISKILNFPRWLKIRYKAPTRH